MALGLVGRKVGMSRVFSEDGRSTPVTIVEVEPNRVTQVRTIEKDGYAAVQVTVGQRRPSRVTKPMAGHFAKGGVGPGRGLWEFRLDPVNLGEYKPGAEVKVDEFEVGAKVDVQGTTIGKGFAGVMKRHGFGGGRATHGNSKAHRKPGSIGQNQDPARVFPGKKMPGDMGTDRRVQQGLEVTQVDVERNLILIKGSIPGARGADVIIRPAAKAVRAKA